MTMKPILRFLLAGFFMLCLGLYFSSCSNDLEVYAPAKDIFVVYGILNPGNAVQTIRVSKAFQVEGDAYEFAKLNDLSAKNMQVRLYYMDRDEEKFILFNPIDTVRQSKQFAKEMTVYQTREKILAGKTYRLEILTGSETRPALTAETKIPAQPFIIRPAPDTINNQDAQVQGNIPSFPLAFFNTESYAIEFSRGNRDAGSPGAAYEMRFFLKYKDDAAGPEKEVIYGPTNFFTNSTGQCLLTGGTGGFICYKVGRSVQNFLNSFFRDQKPTYDAANMSRAARVEITGVDINLYNYIRVNAPAFDDFTTVRPEYSNINGGLGVFGSSTSDSRFVRLPRCTQYLSNLNNVPAPTTDCP